MWDDAVLMARIEALGRRRWLSVAVAMAVCWVLAASAGAAPKTSPDTDTPPTTREQSLAALQDALQHEGGSGSVNPVAAADQGTDTPTAKREQSLAALQDALQHEGGSGSINPVAATDQARTVHARVANSAQWSDPRGDGDAGLAPDITTVTVSNTDNGLLTIRIEMPLERYLIEGTFVTVNFDTDENPATGSLIGSEYSVAIDGDTDTAALVWWDGTRWQWRNSSLRWSWNDGPTIEINARDIGNPQGFNLEVGASWEGVYDTYYDWAPDVGSWNYQVRAPAPPPPPPPAAGVAQWADPAGDQDPGAPDITAVTVSDDGVGTLTVRAETPREPSLASGRDLFVFFDTDRNPATGAPEFFEGTEYYVVFDEDSQTASLGRWDGSEWQSAASSVSARWDHGPTFTLDLREIGNQRGFNFWALAVKWGSGDTWDIDAAPDSGTWNYQAGTGSAPPPAPPPPAPPPPEPESDVFVRPTAGGEWAYTAPAVAYTGGRVVVHYVTEGRDAPLAGDVDEDGTPDYVEEIAEAADAALGQFERLGFKAPLPDTGGPDGRPDLYVKRPEQGILGIAVSHRFADGGAFLLIHPGLDTAANVLQDVSLRATVAHELFHLIQFAYTPGGEMPRWISEGTASAAEAIAYPDLDETNWFLQVGGWLDEPWRPLHDEEFHCDRCYGGALWWLTLHQDDPGLLPAYFDRIGLLARLGRPFGIATGVLNTIIGQRTNSARAPPGPGGRLPISVGEFDSLHGALAEFAEGIYRGGLKPGTLRQVKPRKKPRTTRRSIQLAGFSIHYLPVKVKANTRLLKITVKATSGRPPDVRLLIGGPSGRTIMPRSQGATQKITTRLRNRKDRRTVMLIITSGYRDPAAYRITHQAR